MPLVKSKKSEEMEDILIPTAKRGILDFAAMEQKLLEASKLAEQDMEDSSISPREIAEIRTKTDHYQSTINQIVEFKHSAELATAVLSSNMFKRTDEMSILKNLLDSTGTIVAVYHDRILKESKRMMELDTIKDPNKRNLAEIDIQANLKFYNNTISTAIKNLKDIIYLERVSGGRTLGSSKHAPASITFEESGNGNNPPAQPLKPEEVLDTPPGDKKPVRRQLSESEIKGWKDTFEDV